MAKVQSSGDRCKSGSASHTWDRPELSCGEMLAILPDGKSFWAVVGPVAEAWEIMFRDISKLAQEHLRETNNQVIIVMYMMGLTKLTTAPMIIFCSKDIAARRSLRMAVKQSGILEAYPPIGLGDASSLALQFEDKPVTTAMQPPPDPATIRMGQSLKGLALRFRSSGQVTPQSTQPSGKKTPRTVPTQFPGQNISKDLGSSENPSRQSAPPATATKSVDSNSESCLNNSSRRSWPSATSSQTTTYPDTELHITSYTPTDSAKGKEIEEPEVSSDHEFYSVSEEAEELEGLSEYDPLRQEICHIEEALFRSYLYATYRAHNPGYQASRNQAISSNNPGSVVMGPGASSQRPPKHGYEDDECPDDSGPPSGRPPKHPKLLDPNGRLLACPYYKMDRRKYSHCAKLVLRRVNYVKQHLHKRHRPPIRCPRCQKIFETQELVRLHLLEDVRCPPLQKVEDDAITNEQADQLHHRGRRDTTQEEQWFEMWDIVFPLLRKPSSPYLEDDGLVEEMAEFRSFVASRGPLIARQVLRQSGTWTVLDEQRGLAEALTNILDRMCEDYMLQRPSLPPAMGARAASLLHIPRSRIPPPRDEEEDNRDDIRDDVIAPHPEWPTVDRQQDSVNISHFLDLPGPSTIDCDDLVGVALRDLNAEASILSLNFVDQCFQDDKYDISNA